MSALQRVERAVALSQEVSAADQFVALAEASISQDQRDEWKRKGYTLQDGSYPIPNETYLRKAIQSFGRCPPEKRAALKRHIQKRARELGVDISDSKLVAASDVGDQIIALAFGGKKAPPFAKKAGADDGESEGSGNDSETAEVAKLPPEMQAKYKALRQRGMDHSTALKACKGGS